MRPVQHAILAMALAVTLSACDDPMAVSALKDTRPAIDPIRFFTGHVRSWGVLEDRSGQPTDIVTTDCIGTPDGPDGLNMTQTLQIGTDAPMKRQWHMRRTGPGTFEATANDMVGTATGEAAGRAFHWQWTLALSPGNSLKNVTMDQWWYLQSDGSLINRTTIRKLGVIAAEVTEHFVPDH